MQIDASVEAADSFPFLGAGQVLFVRNGTIAHFEHPLLFDLPALIESVGLHLCMVVQTFLAQEKSAQPSRLAL